MPLYHKESHREYGPARRGGSFGMSPVRRGYRGGGDVASVGIFKEAEDNNCGIYCDRPDLRIVYWVGSDVRFQSETDLVGSGLYPGGIQRIQ